MNSLHYRKRLILYRMTHVNANKITLNGWLEHFNKTYIKYQNKITWKIFSMKKPTPKNDIFDAPISEVKVNNNIKRIRSGNSGQPDGILIEMLKTTFLKVCPIKACFQNRGVKTILCPILRKGNNM